MATEPPTSPSQHAPSGDPPRVEETEVIHSRDLEAQSVAHVKDPKGRRQWVLAMALLVVIAAYGSWLLWAATEGRLTTDQASALAGTLITPLATLLGTAVVFYFRDA